MTKVFFLFALLAFQPVMGQTADPKIVDVVWLRDGSKLSGTILKWDMARGMEFELITGAVIQISRVEIRRVLQDIPFAPQTQAGQRPYSYMREPRPYAFKEEGMYHTFSGFFNTSFLGGAGLHYSIGYRFNRLLGVGLGAGFESNDLGSNRDIIPVYAEARGFLLPKKITPYYALKIGYGFALKDEEFGTLAAQGGLHFSPEFGIRFGGRDVSYYLGVEYKIQNATFTEPLWWGWGGDQGTFTDKVSYRRFEFRTGIVF